ncbi:hypothetical protein [Streptomyces sp. SBT349]|uniref:hypothetical protein n=1 Tax=Streptomyces sp. SBT349 TaxID=1580539 RepID=UPI00066AA48F|nr:hypothetical protein [Streptomyces sp. SBT349]
MTTPPPGLLPGTRITADRLNGALLIGRLVFFASRDAAQTITTSGTAAGASGNALSWDNLIVDLLGGYSPSTPTYFTPPIAGWYQLTGETSFEGSVTGTWRGASWLFNGTLPIGGTAKPVAAATANTTVTVGARSVPVLFDGVSDHIEFAPFHNATGSLATATGSARPHVAIYYAGPA